MNSRRRLLNSIAVGPLAGSLSRAARGQTTNGPKTLRIAFRTAETGFDPAQVQDLYSRTVIAHILDAPLEYDYLARPARLRPNTLVAMPEVSSDFRRFTMRLRPGIFFQDDAAFKGKRRELVAADYVYSFKRFYDPRWKSPLLFVLENSLLIGLVELRKRALKGAAFDYDAEVEGVRALDRYTFQINLAQPNPRFVYVLSDASMVGALARDVVEFYGDQIVAHPVGTGPFRLAAWTRSSRIRLERNPDYREETYDFATADDAPDMADDAARLRGRRLPMIDRVEVSIIEESQPRWLAFLQGDLDLLDPVPADFNTLAAPNGKLAPFLAKRDVRMRLTPLADVSLTYFNMDDPLVGGYAPAQVALRRAIALGFDNAEYVRSQFGGFGTVARSPFVPGTFGYGDAPGAFGEFDRARARALLDLFGYVDRDGDGWRERPDGSPLVLEISSSPTQLERRKDELWARFMNALGLRTVFKVAQWPELVRQSMAGKLMMWGYAWQVSAPDSDVIFGMAYGPNKQSINDARFDLPAFNRLFERQKAAPDGAERMALLNDATRQMAAFMPYLLHIHRVYVDLAHPWVKGFRRHQFTTRFWNWIDIDNSPHASG